MRRDMNEQMGSDTTDGQERLDLLIKYRKKVFGDLKVGSTFKTIQNKGIITWFHPEYRFFYVKFENGYNETFTPEQLKEVQRKKQARAERERERALEEDEYKFEVDLDD